MAKGDVLPPGWQVPQKFRDRVGEFAGRQRAMFDDGHLLLVLHAPPKPEDDERKGRFFWHQPDGTWNSDGAGAGHLALSKHLAEYLELLHELEQLDEAAVRAEEYFAVLSAIAPLQRAARHLHQALQQAREMVPENKELINLRDRAYQIERMAELLYAEAKNSLDCIIAQRTEEQAETSYQMAVSAHRLNVLAAFFFPIATLSAVFGVNMLHGWEEYPPPLPILAMLGIGLVIGVVLRIFITRPAPDRTKAKAKANK